MRPVPTIVLCLCLTIALPVHADSNADQPKAEEPESFFGLMERMLRGFFDDVDPHMRRMERDLQALEPEMRRLFGQLRDMVEYEPPEILPNGDILIRRRHPTPDAEGPDQPVPDPDPSDDKDGTVVPPFEL